MEKLLCVILFLSFSCGIKGNRGDHVLDLHETHFYDGCTGSINVVCLGSNITHIPEDLPKDMMVFTLMNTSITVLTKDMFATYPSLQEIYVLQNRLDRIEDGAFNNITNLKKLILMSMYPSETELQEKAFQGIDHLEILSLASNHLKEIPTTQLKNLKCLKQLFLLDNDIQSVREGSLTFSDKLEEVNLQNNMIEHLEDSPFGAAPHLLKLSLTSNRIKNVNASIFNKLVKLEELDLTDNQITSLDSGFCSDTTSLIKVGLSYNKLDSTQIAIAFAKCSKVEFLDLTLNEITEVNSETFQDMTSLRNLVLARNYLQQFPTLALQPLQSLRELDVSQNNITSVEIEPLNGLVNLLMSHNNISAIGNHTFDALKNLKMLDLSYNPIRTISPVGLESLTKMSSIKLNDCNISTLNGDVFMKMSSLETLKIDNNPLRCDCNLVWIVDAVEAETDWVKNWIDEPTCWSPKHMKGWIIKNSRSSDLTCTKPRIEPLSPVTKNVSSGADFMLESNMDYGFPYSTWVLPDGNLATPGPLYTVAEAVDEVMWGNHSVKTTLKVHNVNMTDAGNYTLVSSNIAGSSNVTFLVTVTPHANRAERSTRYGTALLVFLLSMQMIFIHLK